MTKKRKTKKTKSEELAVEVIDLGEEVVTEEEIRISPVKGTPFIGIEIPNKVN